MARASSSKPRATRGGIRRRATGPQIVEAAPGMVGLMGGASVAGASVAGASVAGASVGGGAVEGALGVAEVLDRSSETYTAYAPQATAAEGATVLAEGGATAENAAALPEGDALAEGAAALPEDAAAAAVGGMHTTTSAGSAAAGMVGAGAAQEGLAAAGAATPARSSAGASVWVPPGLRRWLERARALGLRAEELVFELHVRQGLPLLEVARVLGLGAEQVQDLWQRGRATRTSRAPQSEADFSTLREHICAVLWQTVEATFPDVMHEPDSEDADDEPPAPATPPMLSVRLKALDQIAKLYDVSLEQRPSALSPLPYATPDDIAASVRERVLEMHGRE